MGDRQPKQPTSRRSVAVKAVTAATASGSLLIISGLTLSVTVIVLIVATPLLVIFSPVLIPSGITVFLLVAGFLASGGLGVAAFSVLSWMYKYLTGKRPPGAQKLDQGSQRLKEPPVQGGGQQVAQ